MLTHWSYVFLALTHCYSPYVEERLLNRITCFLSSHPQQNPPHPCIHPPLLQDPLQYPPLSTFFPVGFIIIPPASTKLKGGYTGFTLSVRPSVDRIVSALYLQWYSSDPFHICTSYQATSEGVSCVMFVSKFKNLNFDFVFFWLGIQYDLMVWVIMRRRGVSSERRRSSCSSCHCHHIWVSSQCKISFMLSNVTHVHCQSAQAYVSCVSYVFCMQCITLSW